MIILRRVKAWTLLPLRPANLGEFVGEAIGREGGEEEEEDA